MPDCSDSVFEDKTCSSFLVLPSVSGQILENDRLPTLTKLLSPLAMVG